jgi:hypothetical protein
MAASLSASHGFWSNPGNGKIPSVVESGQSILNLLVAAARRAADYSRLQGLPRHYLDDAGLTPAEFHAALADVGVVDRRESTSTLAHSV